MYEPPPSMYDGPERPISDYAGVLAAISAVVLLVALGVLGLLAGVLGGLFEQREYDAVGYGAVICAGPLLTGVALLTSLFIFQRRTAEPVHWAGYSAGCLLSPLIFMLVAACSWGMIGAMTESPDIDNEPLTLELARQALLASRIALVIVAALGVLLALLITRVLRRRAMRRWR